MTESVPASILDGLTLEAVEWLPSGADTGLVRVRGRWSVSASHPAGLPVLCAQAGGGVSRVDSLPDAPSLRGNGSVWRGAYLVPESVARGSLWLEWESGERSALPTPAGLDERVAPASVLEPEPEEDTPGGEVIDRAVMAERRARRAEAAEQAQARVASEALRALDALEMRGTELEQRVEALSAERDALAEQARALEARTPRDEHQRRALSDALAAAAAARRQAREWRVRMRAAEVARSSDAVRLRVLEARQASALDLRAVRAAELAALEAERADAVAAVEAERADAMAALEAVRAEHAAAVEVQRTRADELAAEALRAREQAVAAAADLDDARRDFGRRLDEAGVWQGRAVEAEAQLERARGELADREAELTSARTELAEVRARIADLEAALESERAARATAGAEAETARSEAASAGAALRVETVARAALEDELQRERAARSALSDALDAETDALASLHVELNAERRAREAERSELEALRAAGPDPELTTLREDLEAERATLATLRADLEAERATAAALREQLAAGAAAQEAALAALGDDLAAERRAREADQDLLATLRDDLAEERSRRDTDEAVLRSELDSLRAQLERGGGADAAQLRAEMESARAADRAVLAALRADLNAERAAREADQAALETARAELRTAELRLAQAGATGEGGLLERVAELDRRAAGLADELELQRRAREQAEAAAAAARGPVEESDRVVADLDAAASSLRERATNGVLDLPDAHIAPEEAAAAATTEQAAPEETAPEEAAAAATTDQAAPEEAAPEEAALEETAPGEAPEEVVPEEIREDRVAPDDVPPEEVGADQDSPEDVPSGPDDVAAAPAEAVPAAAPPERERRAIVSAPQGPARAHATGRSQRQYPWLRGALVKLAHDDPEAAGRIIAGLLPVQAAIVQGPVDYDITIAEVGTFAVTIAGGRAWVKSLEAPRGRSEAEFHLAADALTLAELIAGVPHRLGRFRGPARISGRKRRSKPLEAVPAARLSLAEAARAGARLDPGLVFRSFPYVIHAAWARDQSFTVAQQIAGDPAETWYVTIGNGRGMRVSTTPPEGGADATVTMTREAFGHLLRGEPVPAAHRPRVRGDRAAVALLKTWLDRAQGS